MLYSFSSIHVTWGCCQRSRACLHSIEVDRARHHGSHTENYTCKQVHEGNISAMRGAKKHHCSVPTVNDRVAIFRTRCPCENRTKLDLENTPGYHSTKGCYDNLRFQGTSAGHMERSPHSAPCALCSWHGTQLFRVFFQKFSTKLLTFSVILIEVCMAGRGPFVDVGPAMSSACECCAVMGSSNHRVVVYNIGSVLCVPLYLWCVRVILFVYPVIML